MDRYSIYIYYIQVHVKYTAISHGITDMFLLFIFCYVLCSGGGGGGVCACVCARARVCVIFILFISLAHNNNY